MNEDIRKNTPSKLDVQRSELDEEQLSEAVGGIDLTVIMPMHHNRRCGANPSHVYYAQNSYDV